MHYLILLASDNLKVETIESVHNNVVHYYSIKGFNAVIALVDDQFKPFIDRNRLRELIIWC